MTEHRPWFAGYPEGVPRTLAPYPEKSLYSFLEEAARGHPHAPAIALWLPGAPMGDPGIVRACSSLVTSLGLRTLSPDDPQYRGRHRGAAAQRDQAYHQGTVWPWLIGPYVDAAVKTGIARTIPS